MRSYVGEIATPKLLSSFHVSNIYIYIYTSISPQSITLHHRTSRAASKNSRKNLLVRWAPVEAPNKAVKNLGAPRLRHDLAANLRVPRGELLFKTKREAKFRAMGHLKTRPRYKIYEI